MAGGANALVRSAKGQARPITRWHLVVPNDNANLPFVPQQIYNAGAAGSISLIGPYDENAVTVPVAAATVYDWSPDRILSTGTTVGLVIWALA